MKQHELYYVTGNKGKFEEISAYVSRYEPSFIVKHFDVDIDEIQSLDQKIISIDKAEKAWLLLKKPLLIDDGGMYFEGYNNFPGTLTKYVFEGIGYSGIFKLIDEGSRATFRMHMAYADDRGVQVFEQVIHGTIVKNFSGHAKLPLDAIFKPDGSDKTYAEMRGLPEFDERFGYRQQAFKKFLAWFKQNRS